MENYFLIARNKRDNSFTVLKLNDAWYLGKDKAKGHVSRANSLEAIDLVTSRFEDREQMVERLAKNGYISDTNVDVFVASKRKKDGKSYIKFEEVVYGPKRTKRTEAIRRMATASMEESSTEDKEARCIVFDDLIAKMYFCDDFYYMVMDGETNVSSDIARALKKVQTHEEIPYDLKDERIFKVSSYSDLRNIVEALNRLDSFSATSKDDRIQMNIDFIGENYSDRMAIAPMLALELDKDFCEGQLSMFSYFDAADSEKIRKASERVAEESGKPIKKVEVPKKKLSISDMQREVFRVIKTLPTNLFRSKNGKYEFNEGVFTHPILDEEREQLNSILTGNMPKFFMNYALHTYRMEEANRMGEYSEAAELNEYCERDLASIKKRFRSSKCVVNTYQWCMLYEGCKKRDDAYSASGISVGNSDVNAKVYDKK